MGHHPNRSRCSTSSCDSSRWAVWQGPEWKEGWWMSLCWTNSQWCSFHRSYQGQRSAIYVVPIASWPKSWLCLVPTTSSVENPPCPTNSHRCWWFLSWSSPLPKAPSQTSVSARGSWWSSHEDWHPWPFAIEVQGPPSSPCWQVMASLGWSHSTWSTWSRSRLSRSLHSCRSTLGWHHQWLLYRPSSTPWWREALKAYWASFEV
jgi:hypothetical protein